MQARTSKGISGTWPKYRRWAKENPEQTIFIECKAQMFWCSRKLTSQNKLEHISGFTVHMSSLVRTSNKSLPSCSLHSSPSQKSVLQFSSLAYTGCIGTKHSDHITSFFISVHQWRKHSDP